MKKHRLILLGGTSDALRVPASVLQEAVGALLEGARRATRFLVEGDSVRKGPRPAWLEAACQLAITALTPGSAVVELEAPTLAEADPSRFGSAQPCALFGKPEGRLADRTAVDLFGTVLASVVEGDLDDVVADRALLDTCARFGRLARGAYEGVKLDGLATPSASITVRSGQVAKIEALRDDTPPPQAVRVTGVLDTISATRPDVVLTLPDGTRAVARLKDHDVEALRQLFDGRVVVSGMARYGPSGRLLVIDVESIQVAADRDDLFEAIPVSRRGRPVAPLVPQDETSGVSAFFGTWPGDERDEELLEALRAIR